MQNAFLAAFAEDFRNVVLIGTDFPDLPVEIIEKAANSLASKDAVIGPARDGGYYLIGLRKPARRLLREVQMSTPHVLADTLRLAREENLRVALLPPWYDVDDQASLRHLIAELRTSGGSVAPHTRSALERMGRLHGDFRGFSLFDSHQDPLP